MQPRQSQPQYPYLEGSPNPQRDPDPDWKEILAGIFVAVCVIAAAAGLMWWLFIAGYVMYAIYVVGVALGLVLVWRIRGSLLQWSIHLANLLLTILAVLLNIVGLLLDNGLYLIWSLVEINVLVIAAAFGSLMQSTRQVIKAVSNLFNLMLRGFGFGNGKPPGGPPPVGSSPEGEPEGNWFGLVLVLLLITFSIESITGILSWLLAFATSVVVLALVSLTDRALGNTLGLNLAFSLAFQAIRQRIYDSTFFAVPILAEVTSDRSSSAFLRESQVRAWMRTADYAVRFERFIDLPDSLAKKEAFLRPDWIELDAIAARTQHAQLLTQRGDPTLLARRLMELLTALAWDRYVETGEMIEIPILHLIPDRWGTTLGWRVALEMSRASLEIYRQLLREFRFWTSLRVDWIPPRGAVMLGLSPGNSCKASGKLGSLGGKIKLNGEEYGLTCAHVLSKGCSCVYTGVELDNRNAPDVAILNINASNQCYSIPNATIFEYGLTIPDSYVEHHVQATPIVKLNARHPGCEGKYHGKLEMSATWRGQPMIEFDNVMIQIDLRMYFYQLLLNPFRSAFSNAGDSGCSVVDRTQKTWFGVLVRRDKIGLNYYAIEPKSALKYLEDITRNVVQQTLVNSKSYAES
jgi:hypothetical protein